MLFKVMTVGRTEAIITHGDPHEMLKTKTVFIPPKTILDVYGYVQAEDARFVVWNDALSLTFFTISVNDCRPA